MKDDAWRSFVETLREAYRAREYPLGYSASLDGLRGLMTLFVMLAHIRLPLVPGALLCMDVFFVMSGYFITGLLLRDVERHGAVRFADFYRRRLARIVPPFAVMVAAYLVFRSLFFPPFTDALLDAGIGFSYIANWWRAWGWNGISYMGHTWSLAAEEQFYIIWPVTFVILVRLLGTGWRLVGAIVSVALGIWLWRIWLTWNGAPFWRLYNGLDTRADALAIGCALAVALGTMPQSAFAPLDRVLQRLAWPLAIYFALVLVAFVDYKEPVYYYIGIMPLALVPGAALVVLLVRPIDTVLHRLCERPALVFLGHIFYGMYLWHFPIFFLLKDLAGVRNLPRALIGFPLTIAIAALSYAFLERHFMRSRSRHAVPS